MHFSKRWKTPRVMYGLLITEAIFTVAALALFGIAAPNTYRTKLWEDGSLNGFNSNPNIVVFAYANHRPIPKVPMVWRQFITNWNVVISVLSLFILLVESILFVVKLFYPLLSLIVHVILTALWAVSVYGQAGPDKADPERPSSTPWYLRKSCSVAREPSNVQYCQQAKATFAVTVLMLVLFVVHIPLAMYSMFPLQRSKDASDGYSESNVSITHTSPDSYVSSDKPWEMGAVPKAPLKSPATPRTMAFNTLISRC